MAVTKVVMPKLSEAMETGKLLRWLKQEGDRVAGGDIIAEVETDKADIELEAFGSGVLRKVLVAPGATVPVGNVIAVIAEPDEDISSVVSRAPSTPPPAPSREPVGAGTPTTGQAARAAATAPTALASAEEAAEEEEPPVAGQRLRASPLAKRLAQKAGVDLTRIGGTGPGGRVIQRDVEAFLAARPAATPPPAAVPAAPRPAVVRPAAEYEDQPLSQIRAAIARQMAQSKAPVPHFYVTTEIAMERAAALREELQALPGAPKVTVTDLIVRACALTLLRHPGVNASFQGQSLRRYRAVHIGVAVALDDGLITPVLRDCDQKSLFQIATEARDLIERTRARKLRAHELSGATFSVSNLGMFPVDEFSAIINPPEGAILAVGAIVEKPVVAEGQLTIGKRMRLTLSCDHRVMDGVMGARFLGDLRALLEAPLGLLV
ncbi:MAG: 2-oxo acid dehydrogenase subunit E2 [Candidatus Rokubacteria bacterium]|nr:2-oxo acid dehydrogenase subunit E2 [Candidatus Rokubacteria bacterium]